MIALSTLETEQLEVLIPTVGPILKSKLVALSTGKEPCTVYTVRRHAETSASRLFMYMVKIRAS